MDINEIEEELGKFSFDKEEVLSKLLMSSIDIEAGIKAILINQIDILHKLDGDSKTQIAERIDDQIEQFRREIFTRKMSS